MAIGERERESETGEKGDREGEEDILGLLQLHQMKLIKQVCFTKGNH